MNMKSLGMYGAQGNGTTVAQFLGVNSRAALAAFSVAGQTPYAFAATQPFTAGDDIWVRSPTSVPAGTTTINFSAPMTTSGGSFTDPQGCHFVPVSTNGLTDPHGRANFRAYRGMTLSGGGLAQGTLIVATHDNGLIVTAQPAGFSVPNGAQLVLGVDLSGVAVGMQMWAAHGLSPLCTVTAISGQNVTVSAPVVSFTTPLGNVRPGIDLLAQVCFYTPLAESTLTQNISMDTLAFLAAYNNATYGDTVFVDPLVYCFKPHIMASGGNVTFAGPPGGMAAFSSTANSTMIKLFPTVGATAGFYNILWRSYNGCLPAYLEVDGAGFMDVTPNLCGVALRLENNSGYVGGYNASNPAASCGAYAQFKLRNIGNLRANDNSFQGFGRTVYGACQFDLSSVVLGYMNNNGAGYVWSQAEQNGYCEDLIMRDWCQDSSGAAFDGINSGIFNGYSNLIWKFSGGDNDVSRVITRIVGGLEITLHDAEASFNGCQNIPGAAYVFNGCTRGSILGVQGGTGGGGNGQPVDLIQFGSATLNGNQTGTQQFRVAEVSVGGFTTAVRCFAGSNNNSIDMDSIINWGSAGVVDLGSNQHTGGLTVAGATFSALSAAENAAINAAVGSAVQGAVLNVGASLTPPMISAINNAVQVSVASASATLTSPVLTAIASAVGTAVASATATVPAPVLAAINSAVSVAVAALPVTATLSGATALPPTVMATLGSMVTAAVAAQPVALTPGLTTSIGSTVAALVAAQATPLINAAVVHNPTYFSGGFTNLLTVPGGGNGVTVKLTNYGDAGNNFNGTNYIVPSNGIYRVMAVVKMQNTGVVGACPAYTSVGVLYSGYNTVNFDMMQFDTTTTLRTTIRFELDVYYTAGTPLTCIIYSDVGTQARNGTMTIMRVA